MPAACSRAPSAVAGCCTRSATLRFAFGVNTHIVRGLASVRNTSSKGMGLGLLSMKMDDRRKMYGFLKHFTT